MSSDQRLNELESEVKRLEGALTDGSAAARRSARATLAIASSLALVVVAFIIANFVNLKSEWTQEKFSESLDDELAELRPTAERELKKLGNQILPVYMKEGKAQIELMGPQMGERFESELDLLCKDITVCVHDRLHSTQTRVKDAVHKAIYDSFPNLQDDVQSELLKRRFQDVTEQSIANAMVKFDKKFGQRVDEFKQTLVTFDISKTTDDPVDLQKKFLGLWLDLLKSEIMEL
jgi:hypothetical protein